MIQADTIYKERVIDILSACLDSNKTVNWIVRQDSKRSERIRNLIDYSFDACLSAGLVYLTEDKNGVMVCSFSDNKLPFLEEAYLTIRFVLKVTGIEGLRKAIRREKYIKQYHPQDEEFIYIWFIGVDRRQHGKGIGSTMLQEIINRSNSGQLSIYTETSVDANLRFYQKYGFEVYHISEPEVFGFKLYFLRRLPDQL